MIPESLRFSWNSQVSPKINPIRVPNVNVKSGMSSPESYPAVTLAEIGETFGTMIERLNVLGVAYLALLEPNTKDAERGVQIEHVAATFRTRVTVPLTVNTGFDKKKGSAILAGDMADAVAFGVPYIANPDLGTRFRSGFATVHGVRLHYGSQHLLASEGESRCVQPARVRMAIGYLVF